MYNKLPLSFYRRKDVCLIARELLGKVLCTQIDDKFTSGIIVETEAYAHTECACHSYGGKRTPRTETFYNDGGIAYVYICYGIHPLFNIITDTAAVADAILIRAIAPIAGTDTMLHRRQMDTLHPRLTAGPGVLSRALGIVKAHNTTSLIGDTIWLEDHAIHYTQSQIIASTRVGVESAGKDALLPWRYRLRDSKWTSPAK